MAWGRQNTVTNLALAGVVGYLAYKAYVSNEFGLADVIEDWTGYRADSVADNGADSVAGNDAPIDDVSQALPAISPGGNQNYSGGATIAYPGIFIIDTYGLYQNLMDSGNIPVGEVPEETE